MSRSFKHVPIGKDWAKSSKQRKTFANRRFRRAKNLDVSRKSMMHKRYTESWDIHDYVFRWTLEEAIASWFKEEYVCATNGWDIRTYGWHRRYKTLDEFINHCWRRCVYYK